MVGKMTDYSVIVLAAGFSSRMKSFKPLLPLGDSTVIDTVIASYRSAGVDDILVVVGHRGDEIRTHLVDSGVTVVENPTFEQGMFTSIQAGTACLADNCRAFFMQPVDIPLCRPWTIKILGEEFERTTPAVLFPTFGERKGHPPLISGRLIGEIQDAGDVTLRDILARHRAESAVIEVPDRFILMDADTPEAYHRLAELTASRDIPTARECEIMHQRLGPLNGGVVEHCRAVARVAESIGQALQQNGVDLDLDLITAAALLHDIARDHRDHSRVGAEWIGECGFPRVAEIVARHTDMVIGEHEGISEAEIVYLADKMVKGDQVRSIEDRYQAALAKYGDDRATRRQIDERRRRAELSRARIEARLECSVAEHLAKGP